MNAPRAEIYERTVTREGYAFCEEILVRDADGREASLGYVGEEVRQVEQPVRVENRYFNIGRKVPKSNWYAIIPAGIDIETAGYVNNEGELLSVPTAHRSEAVARSKLLDYSAVRRQGDDGGADEV